MASTSSTTESAADPTPSAQADAESAAAEGALRLLLFGVGGCVYGCEIAAVREILPFRRPTRLPGAPPFVAGLINLRGTVTTVLDLGVRFGGEAVDASVGSIVLVEHGAKVVGLAVDDVRDVQPLGVGELDPVAGEEAQDGLVLGLGRVDGGAAVVLDVRAMVGQVLL